MGSKTKNIDYLTEDKPIPGQLWACISFLSPEGLKNCSIRGLKIRGVFGTRKEADKHALELQKMDPDFNVFVGEVGKWLPWDPDVNDVEDQIYQEKELQNLMKEYKNNLAKTKEVEQQRKNELLEKAAREEQSKNMNPVDRKRAQMRSKLEANKKNLIDTNFKEDDEEIKKEKEELSKISKDIEANTNTINDYDDKISKMMELYNKVNKK